MWQQTFLSIETKANNSVNDMLSSSLDNVCPLNVDSRKLINSLGKIKIDKRDIDM